MKNNMYVFLDKKKEGIFYFSGAVQREEQAKLIVKTCLEAERKIEYTEVSIKTEENSTNIDGLFLLLESRYSNGTFYPNGTIVENKLDAEKFVEEAPLGVPRKYVDIEIVKPHKALSLILQNE